MFMNDSTLTTADALLLLLRERGIDYIFGNTGTEYPALIASMYGFQERGELGQKIPIPLAIHHENVAMNMAYGYYLATGRPQAIMVHTSPGTANSLGGIINANRAKIPLLLIAGKPPVIEATGHRAKPGFIHWAQESFDQASLVREHVKWDYHLSRDNGLEVELIVDRALTMALAEPRGPVYLTFSTEAMDMLLEGFTYRQGPLPPTTAAYPDPQAIEQIAEWIDEAGYPLLITGGTSRDPAIFTALQRLVTDRFLPIAAMVPRNLPVPTTLPLYFGTSSHPAIPEADLIVVLDTDVPWIPFHARPKPDCKVVHIGSDPLFQRYPRRGFRADLILCADPALALSALYEATTTPAAKVQHQRQTWVETARETAARKRQIQIERAKQNGEVNFSWVSHCLAEALHEDDVLVNEFDLDANAVQRTQHGSYYGVSNAGGLGWGIGVALGVKLAEPERTVILTTGDGSYYFGNPAAGHAVSNMHHLPFLTIVFNNAKWNTVVNYVNRYYPQVESTDLPLTGLGPHPHFEKIVEAFNGYGECVEHPDELPGALQRVLHAVRREGRQALLNIIC